MYHRARSSWELRPVYYLFLTSTECVELFETVAVDDVLQSAIGIMTNLAAMVEDHDLTNLSGIGLPSGQRGDIRIAIVGKLHPDATHQVGQFQVVGCGQWHRL